MSNRVSAVVCTYNRKDQLVDALETLVAQDLPRAEYEILVVDNASTDGTADAIRTRFSGVENLRVVREARQGVGWARNTGARECRSPIVAYLDDDTLAPRDWLRRFVEAYDGLDPSPGVIGGEIEPIFGGERPSWLSDELLRPLSVGMRWSAEPRYLHSKAFEWICENNSAYRVELLLEHGGFAAHLGRVGHNLMSGENCVNTILEHAGHRTYYDPRIVVQHRVPASRLNRAWFRRRMFWQGVSQYAMREYLKEHGIDDWIYRPVNVPCSATDWVRVFDDHVEDAEFPRVLDAFLHMGYLLASQKLMGDGR